ncbi:apoptotic chromatin condensation inducer in the nucleus isoform X1 [Neodiprion virginianus]|uniref:apoptotic chromatin condensation inducer in the nucleus isoform X1 n=2 Tax=Neodiprion virginianus TaxID=2961670 RepID=UPI001EE6F66D|nr:apoptotic chromatin condensation inducer in the nucleus isoform X1 [Neodiprion virginianus]
MAVEITGIEMRRKSERNKSKGSPEKKVEKATRKSTRKRGRRATSSSPEREEFESKSVDLSKEQESIPESMTSLPATRLKIRELKAIAEEESLAKQISSSSSAPPSENLEEGGGEGASVWKVARADASPGEIQKLKLCRQRNPSEASDSSSSRKKSHKSYESGEGDGEEGDSTEEPLRSRKRDLGEERQDDPSSPNPGQDSKEEVSHCREILPRTTSANFTLSDDKKNVDRLADNNADQAIRYDQNCPVQKSPKADTNEQEEPSSNGDDLDQTKAPIVERQASEDVDKNLPEGRKGKEEVEKVGETEAEAVVRLNEVPINDSQADEKEDSIAPAELETRESSTDEDSCSKPIASSVTSETKIQTKRSELLTSLRTVRRKHRDKYHESSDSDTPESEDEPNEKKTNDSQQREETGKESAKIKSSRSPSPVNRFGFCAEVSADNKTESSGEIEERRNSPNDCRPCDQVPVNSLSADYKPAKVNLKRSFSVRLMEAEESIKKDDAEKNGESEVSLRVKEIHNVAEQADGKNLPRKRRWGVAVTAESTPAFTVSTDSLKALVPGAKPLSITEVRLSKDDDEPRERRKEREKRRSISADATEPRVSEDIAMTKNENTKKGDLKHDNHIGAKRKISILKEAPPVKSPSPSLAKATNVLLIKNLVRPFTLNQIKELLSRTGTIIENGFWIDGIKSKCYVVYANEDQAFETRQALHGISWPLSNPKRLQVEYATIEDVEKARELFKDQPALRAAEPSVGGDTWQQVWAREEKQNAPVKVNTVREWDLGKEDGHQMKEKERGKKDLEKKRRQRSRSPPIEPHLPPPARKFKKKEDDPPPAKLLDDLFKKTKAIPCIYWLPLTNEQIVVKEEMRRQHMAEHARRLEEMKRAERSRDPAARRRRSPRK